MAPQPTLGSIYRLFCFKDTSAQEHNVKYPPPPEEGILLCEKFGPPDKLLAYCKQVDLPMNKDLWVVHVDVFALGGGD